MTSEIRSSAGGFKAGRRWLSWGLAVALVALSFAFVDLNKVYEAIFTVPSSYVIIGVIICLADRALMALRWFLLIRGMGGRVAFFGVMVASLKSNTIGMLIHSIAGDLAKVAYMRRELDVHAILIPSLVADRAIGLAALAPLGVCGLLYLNTTGVYNLKLNYYLQTFIISTVILAVISILLTANPKNVLRDGKMIAYVRKWVGAICIVRMRFWLCGVIVIAILRQCLGIVLVLAYVTHIDRNVDAMVLVSIVAIQFVIMRLPISPDGWGVGELTAVSLYGLANVQPEAALVAMLLFRAAYWVSCLPGLSLILWDGERLTGSPRRISAGSY